ncbi:IPTL-CTERM sorting domain-containing protein [Thioalkalivibrio sp. ALE11]|uniref:IPTL-CTERM sorting domain-containing protein n=1 Tax=Thioalkalivibrio sp. ALE11 TaxID=1265494 RepID=UPI00037EC8D1|nr:IPTL-CTERM sorting domain-containing protein [Thioalkalivibrio sp. ALE11]
MTLGMRLRMFQAFREHGGRISVTGPGAGRGGIFSAAVLLAGLCTMAVPAQADTPPDGLGDFRVQNYATGTGNDNFWWRGYVFKPSREVDVVGMWGGSGPNCNAFSGAILEADLITDPEDSNSPAYEIGDLLANVNWTLFEADTPEYLDFDAPITLQPDQYYFIGQGQDEGNSGSGCHFNTDFLDFENLEIGSAIIDEWFPRGQLQYYHDGTQGDGSQLENTTHGTSGGSADTDPVRILVGLRYETDVVPAEFDPDVGTGDAFSIDPTTSIVEGQLTSTGAAGPEDVTTLYFEIGQQPDLSDGELVPSTPANVTGELENLSFAGEQTDLDAGETYYYRAIAVNEGGRSEGSIQSFEQASDNFLNAVTGTTDDEGVVVPAIRGVEEGDTGVFTVVPEPGFFRQLAVGGDCPEGTWEDNTYTTGEITEACTAEFNIADTEDVAADPQYTISGNVSGLSGTGLELQRTEAGDDLLEINEDGPFEFISPDLFNYDITVAQQPTEPQQRCDVSNGAGFINGSDASGVEVECGVAYTVGGSVAGLDAGESVTLTLDGEELTVSSDGEFGFSSLFLSGESYSATVANQPSAADRNCSISDGSGTIGSEDVTSLSVSCATFVEGACGSADGQESLFAPSTNLCASGDVSSVLSESGGHSWICEGSGGGETASCSAPGAAAEMPEDPNGNGVPEEGSGVTMNIAEGQCDVNEARPVAAPDGGPEGYSMPFGMVDFSMVNCESDRVTLEVTFSGSVEDMVYWKYLDGEWLVMDDALLSGNTATFTIVDGGPFDADPTEGAIADPSGPGLREMGPEAEPRSIPTLSSWGVLIMSGLLTLIGLLLMRRRINGMGA